MSVNNALDDFLMSDMSATFEDSDSEIDYSPIANSLRESQVNPLRESQVDYSLGDSLIESQVDYSLGANHSQVDSLSIKQKYSPNEKINCSCGMTYTRTNRSRHLKKYHSTAEEIMNTGYVYQKLETKKYNPNENINCSCGMTYTRTNKSRHFNQYHNEMYYSYLKFYLSPRLAQYSIFTLNLEITGNNNVSVKKRFTRPRLVLINLMVFSSFFTIDFIYLLIFCQLNEFR